MNMIKRNQYNSQNGFTLLEVLLSLTIILILVLAFSGGIINSFRTESRVDQRLEAIRINNSIIESLRVNKEDWNSLDEWENVSNNIWDNVNDDINNYTVGIDSNSDIIVECHPSDIDNLFLFKIKWEDRSYSSKVLLAGG